MARAMLSFGWGHAKQPLAVTVLGRAGSRHIPRVSAPLGAWGHEEPREGSRNPAPGGWGVCGHGALLWRGTILYFFPLVEVHMRSGCQTNKRAEAKAPKRQSKQLITLPVSPASEKRWCIHRQLVLNSPRHPCKERLTWHRALYYVMWMQ